MAAKFSKKVKLSTFATSENSSWLRKICLILLFLKMIVAGRTAFYISDLPMTFKLIELIYNNSRQEGIFHELCNYRKQTFHISSEEMCKLSKEQKDFNEKVMPKIHDLLCCYLIPLYDLCLFLFLTLIVFRRWRQTLKWTLIFIIFPMVLQSLLVVYFNWDLSIPYFNSNNVSSYRKDRETCYQLAEGTLEISPAPIGSQVVMFPNSFEKIEASFIDLRRDIVDYFLPDEAFENLVWCEVLKALDNIVLFALILGYYWELLSSTSGRRNLRRQKQSQNMFVHVMQRAMKIPSPFVHMMQRALKKLSPHAEKKETEELKTNFLSACLCGDKQAIKDFIREDSCDLNEVCPATGNTGLHFVCYAKQHSIAQIILHHGKLKLDINMKNKENKTPLELAAAQGSFGIVKDLLKMKTVNLSADDVGESAAVEAVKNEHFEIAQIILDRMDALEIEVQSFFLLPSCVNRCVTLTKEMAKANLAQTKNQKNLEIIEKYKTHIIVMYEEYTFKDTRTLKEEDSNFQNMLRDLECPICLEEMQEEIVSCQNDHWMCQECAKDISECPCCRVSFTPANPPRRCITGEKIVRNFVALYNRKDK